MPKKGYKQSASHIAARRERTRETGMINGALDFFRFMMTLNPEDRRELLADRLADAEEILKENDRLRARGAGRGIRNSSGSLSDPAYVERFRNALRDDIHRMRSQEDKMADATHEPMTGQHSHTHAAFGADDADDGMHGHRHTHSDDADHDHAHDRASQSPGVNPNASASGTYGMQMEMKTSPAERRRLRNAQIAEHEARRGGS